jgi:peptidoglycan hydrolase CwlO-like protein
MFLKTGIALLFLSISVFPTALFAQSADQIQSREDDLRGQLDAAQKELQALTAKSNEIKSQKASLQRDVALIDAEIREAQARINVKNLTITRLTKDIGTKENTINNLEVKLERSAESLADLLRRTNETDSISTVSIILGNKSFSNFYSVVDSVETIKGALNKSMDDVKEYKEVTETEKASLEDRKNQETNARAEILAEQRVIERKKAEKNAILSATKGQESAYANLIQDKERKIAQISSALFSLRDSDGIPFGTALDIATRASKNTGVRPAFVLAILMQETSLGKNLGSCYLRDYTTGSGVGVNTGTTKPRTMSPTRDVPVFLEITRELGLNPQSQRVSCWIAMYSKNQPIGWGGAMGPAQFIPSTWTIFDERIEKALGVGTANPWIPEHAILASSMYLGDLGAGLQTYTAERDAACRYYSGKKCSAGTGASYGNQVMQKAANIQECMIDPIMGKGSGC